jgi:hypothetical protein
MIKKKRNRIIIRRINRKTRLKIQKELTLAFTSLRNTI